MSRRRLLVVLASLTLVLLVADLAGWGGSDVVRRVGGLALGPVQRVLSGAPGAGQHSAERENARLTALVAEQQHRLDQLGRLERLLGPSPAAGHAVVAARVVATKVGALGGRSVTLDVGSRDGVRADSTVVAADGLVGRVVEVSPWTSDVQVLGSAGSVVAVRVGPAGTLGTVAAPAPGDSQARPRGTLRLSFVQPATPVVGDLVRTLGSVDDTPYAAGIVVGTVATPAPGDSQARPRGTLRLAFVQPATPVVGDLVRTLGSVDDTPYAAGIVVGTVTDVDPERGQGPRTATVRPAVDADALDLVAVVLPATRSTPRPATPSGGAR